MKLRAGLVVVGVALLLWGCSPVEEEANATIADRVGSNDQTSDGRPEDTVDHDVAVYIGLAGGVVDALSIAGVTLQWQLAFDIPATAAVVTREQVAAVALADGTIRAVSLRDGEPLWSTTVSESPVGVWATGVGFCVADRDTLTMLDPESGDVLWSENLPVVQAVATRSAIFTVDGSGTMTAVEAGSGEVRWSTNAGGIDRADPVGVPVILDGVIYFGDISGRICAVAVETGALLWTTDLGRHLTSGLSASARGLLVAVDDGNVVLLHHGDGSEVGEFTVDMDVLAPPLHVQEYLIIPGARGTIVRAGLDDDRRSDSSGYEIGSLLGLLSSHLAGEPMIVGDTLVIGEAAGFLSGTDVESGERRWRVSTGDRIVGSPILHGDSLLVVSANGTITKFDITLASRTVD